MGTYSLDSAPISCIIHIKKVISFRPKGMSPLSDFLSISVLSVAHNYRDGLKGGPVLLSNS